MLFPVSTGCAGGDTCCTPENKCGQDQGDCDTDADCKGELICGTDNCSKKTGFAWDDTDDCCTCDAGDIYATWHSCNSF